MHRAPDRLARPAERVFSVAGLWRSWRRCSRPAAARAPTRPASSRAARLRGAGSSTASAAPSRSAQRMIVVLRNPSLADRMAEAGGRATESAMRSWTAAALAGQKQIAARLSREGIQLVPDFVYTRTFNGFAAPIDGRALALLERDPDVVGVYPVRAAYPASLSRAELLGARRSPPAAAGGPTCGLPGIRRSRRDDRPARHRRRRDAPVHPRPAARRRRRARSRRARGRARPPATSRCGSSVTARRWRACSSAAAVRAASAASRPARRSCRSAIAGWQPSAEGRLRRLQPDRPAAGRPRAGGRPGCRRRRPRRGAHRGRRRHRAVRVVPRRAGRARGRRRDAGWTRSSSSRPGTRARPGRGTAASAAPAARPPRSPSAPPTCGARRRRFASSFGRGCGVLLDRELPLGGAAAPRTPLTLAVTRPRRSVASGPRGAPLARYFDDRGYSLVAGRAAFLARADGPDRRRPRGRARRRGGDPRRRARPGRRSRPRRPPRRPGRRPAHQAAAAALRAAIARGADVRGLARRARLAGQRAAHRRSRRSPRTASPSAAASSRRSQRPASSSSPPIRAGTTTGPLATGRSAARALPRRSPAARRRCSRRRGPSSMRRR